MIIRASKFVLRLTAAVLAALVLLFAVAAWRLSGEPVSLSFLTPYLSDALSDADAGFHATIDDTVLSWSTSDHTLGIRAVNVRLNRLNGQLVAAVPQMAFRFSLRALLHGRLAPTSVDILGIKAKVVRLPDGQFDFGLAAGGEGEGGGEAVAADTDSSRILALLVDEMSKPKGQGIAGYLTRASILDADLSLEDRKLGVTWQARQASLLLWRETGGVRGDLRLGLDLGGQVARVVATGHFDRASRKVTLRARFNDLVPASLAPLAAVFEPLRGFGVPLGGDVSLAATGDGHIENFSFDLHGGKGEVVLPHVVMPPVVVRGLAVRGQALQEFGRIHLAAARLETADFTAALKGDVSLGQAGVGLQVDGEVDSLPTDALPRYWPANVAENARQWIVGNVSSGTLRDIRLRADLPPEALASGKIPAGAITVDFGLSGQSVRYFGPLPLLTDASGAAHLTVQRFELRGVKGSVGTLQVSDGKVDITDLDKEDQDAIISMAVDGQVPAMLTLLDRKPLRFVTPLGVAPASVAGQASVRARFLLPLRKDLTFANVKVEASATLNDVSLPKVADRYDLTQGVLSLQVDKQRMAVQGTAALNGVPVHLLWQEEFLAKGPFSTRYTLNGTIDDRGREALGYDALPYLSGPVPTRFVIETGRRSGARIDGQLDLRQARLEAKDLHWSKPAGEPGTAAFRVDAPPTGAMTLSNLVIDAADLHARGRGRIDKQGLERLDLSTVRFGRNDLAVQLSRTADGGHAVQLDGKSLDLSPFLADSLQVDGAGSQASTPAPAPAPDDAAPPLRVSAALQRVLFGDGREITAVRASAARRGARWEQASAQGILEKGTRLDASLQPVGARRRLLVSAGDAGAVARVAGLSENIVGGSFRLDATLQDDLPGTPMRGSILMQNFKVVKAPVLARLLTVASLTGITEILSGDGIGFVRTEIPFFMTGPVIAIEKARGHGSAMGFTLDGTIDRSADTANLSGTLVPSYTLNTVLGNIPLIGGLLTSRPGEGIFGITYGISGKLSDPKVSVNPLSALAPGILRRMFELGGETGEPLPQSLESGPPHSTTLPKDYSGTKVPTAPPEATTPPGRP